MCLKSTIQIIINVNFIPQTINTTMTKTIMTKNSAQWYELKTKKFYGPNVV